MDEAAHQSSEGSMFMSTGNVTAAMCGRESIFTYLHKH
jgi:hypothetical protein